MDKERLALLAKAYDAEINAALSRSPLWLMQTKSKLATKMVKEGLLSKCEVTVHGIHYEGYELTHAGRMMFCMEL